MSSFILAELTDIQTQLKVPKNQLNKFGGYKFRSCEDILEALKPHLKRTGTSLVISDEIVLIGNRYYVKATAVLRNETQEASAVAYAREPEDKKGMDQAQLTGATSSYARKYALNGLFGIDDEKDADTRPPEESPSNSTPEALNGGSKTIGTRVITEPQRKRLFAIQKAHNVPDEIMRNFLKEIHGLENSKDIPVETYDEICEFATNYKGGSV